MNWWKALLVGLVAVVVAVSPTPVAATTEPEPAPAPERDFVTEPSALIQVPAGCPVPDPADLAFVGTVLAKDEFIEKGTVRFEIDQVRAGDAGPFAVDGVIDVRYGPDSQYLAIDDQVLVSAAVDDRIGALASKVAPAAPLFGGDAVVGLEDSDVECPTVDDPVQTINVDGTPVDSALLTPLLEDRSLLLFTILVPAAIAGAVIIGLVLLRRAFGMGFQGIFALGRAAVIPTGDHRAARVRRHISETEAEALGLNDDGGLDGPSAVVDSHSDDDDRPTGAGHSALVEV